MMQLGELTYLVADPTNPSYLRYSFEQMFRKRFERGNIVMMKQDTGLEVISETRSSDLVPVSYFSERLGTRKRCMGK